MYFIAILAVGTIGNVLPAAAHSVPLGSDELITYDANGISMPQFLELEYESFGEALLKKNFPWPFRQPVCSVSPNSRTGRRHAAKAWERGESSLRSKPRARRFSSWTMIASKMQVGYLVWRRLACGDGDGNGASYRNISCGIM